MGVCTVGGFGDFLKSVPFVHQKQQHEVEPQYTGARIEGGVVTLDFVKKMLDDFKNQKSLHRRYAYQIVLQTREMLRGLPSLVDVSVAEGKHFTVCGDVHGQIRSIPSKQKAVIKYKALNCIYEVDDGQSCQIRVRVTPAWLDVDFKGTMSMSYLCRT